MKNCKTWKKRVTSVVLSLVLVATLLPTLFATPAYAVASTSWTKLSASTGGQTIGTNGQTKYYYIDANTTCSNSNTGGSGLTIAGGATVYIYIPANVTLTCTGGSGSGTTGGGAGIYLPSGSTLYIIGNGTIKATGGAAANGTNGDAGVGGTCNKTTLMYYGGAGGKGGAGGGGGGAGIGTSGSAGGAGGNGGSGDGGTHDQDHFTAVTQGKAGSAGTGPNKSYGTLKIQSTITKTLTGGAAGTKGGGGGAKGNSAFDTDFDGKVWINRHTAGGGAGGGGGGAGYAGAGYGSGGGGGGGGAGGNGAGAYYRAKKWDNWWIVPARGGKGGTGAQSGTAGMNQWDKHPEKSTDNYWEGYDDYYYPSNSGGNGGGNATAVNPDTVTLGATVTYYPQNGGSTFTANATVGADMPAVTKPNRAGYTFAGWYDAASGGNQYYNANNVSVKKMTYYDIALYAQWTENTASLTYNANGHGTAPAAVTMKTTAAANAAAAISATGYTFTGWNTAANGTGTAYAAGAVVKAANVNPAATTLYAQWSQNQNLTYNANGHGTAPSTVTMTYNAVTKAADAITAEGYTFTGWNTAANGTGTKYAAGAQVKAANVDPAATTLYAQWTAKDYTVTLNNGEGSGETSVTATYDADMPKVTVPTLEKHVFKGYFDAAEGGTQYYDAEGKSVRKWDKDDANVTLYAQWVEAAKIDSLSLLLDGDTGLRFHTQVNDKTLEGGHMTMTIGQEGHQKTKMVNFADVPTDDSGKALFTFDVNSIQLAEKVTATFYDANDNVYATESQSVEDYYERIKDNDAVSDNEKAMVKALVNYGYYAQQALSKTNGWVIGTDYAESKCLGAPSTNSLAAYAPVITGSSTHVTGLNLSLLLDNKTTLCLYFTTKDKQAPAVTVDGETAEMEQMASDGRWLVRISNIDALCLGDVHTVTADGYTIYLSALSYGSVITGDENKNAIYALADYYKAALAFAGKTAPSVITSATAESAVYDGTEKTPVLTVTTTGGTTEQYEVTWDDVLINAGTYTGIVKGTNNVQGAATVKFTITPQEVAVPTAESGLTYNKAPQTGVYGNELYKVEGNVATDAGAYTATATLNDTENYCWVGGGTDAQSVAWSIARAKPAAEGEIKITYYTNGEEFTITEGGMSVDGTFSFTNAPQADGATTATFTPDDQTNYETVTVEVMVTINGTPKTSPMNIPSGK